MIAESVDGDVAAFLRQFASITSGYQQKYFKRRLECLEKVRVVPMSELFDKWTVDHLRRFGGYRKKECYSNALHTAELLDRIDEVTLMGKTVRNPEVRYVEGYLLTLGLPIDHAFNKIGDWYFDVTMDLLHGRVDGDSYWTVGEWGYSEALRIMGDNGYYGVSSTRCSGSPATRTWNSWTMKKIYKRLEIPVFFIILEVCDYEQ